MKVAAVITFRNEEKLLRPNLLYHRFIGVDDFFIFSDDTTDDSLKTVEDLPSVHVYKSVSPEEFKDQPGFERIIQKAYNHHTARQCLNTAFAVRKAKRENFDWIISFDADELICLDFHTTKEDQLSTFFDSLPVDVQQVRFQTFEIVQRGIEYQNVFAQETLFKVNSPKIRRRIYDPFHKKNWILKRFYGHNQGKSALSLKAAAIPKTVHSFQGTDGVDLLTVRKKYLLHYNCYCFSELVEKFTNFKDRPNTFLHGEAVEYIPKRLWRDIVNSPAFAEDDLKRYFQRYVMFKEKDIKRLRKKSRFGLLKKQPAILEIDSVKKAFIQMRKATSKA